MHRIAKLTNPVFSILAWIFRIFALCGFYVLFREVENTSGSMLILFVILITLLFITSRNRLLILDNRGLVVRKTYFDAFFKDEIYEYREIENVEILIRFKNYFYLILSPFAGKYIQKGRANIIRITLKDGTMNQYFFLVPGNKVESFRNELLIRI